MPTDKKNQSRNDDKSKKPSRGKKRSESQKNGETVNANTNRAGNPGR